MKMCRPIGVVVLTALGCQFHLEESNSQIPEIPRRGLPGIARVTHDLGGQPVIYYNPAARRRMGPEVTEFFRAHELAHLRLNHFNRNISIQQAEAEADALAARMISPNAAAAAQRWFMSGRGGSRQHGTPRQRANRLSGQAGFSPSAMARRQVQSNRGLSGGKRRLIRRRFRFRQR